ncbi:MAG TPA: hypothetical protein VD772_03075, partial [Anseongella sp.]|nr:hypothetical protein [Anseongella sp.]
LGRVLDAANNRIAIAPDLYESLKIVDQFEAGVTNMIDGYIEAQGLDAPKENLPQLGDGYGQPLINDLDLKKEGITTVVWAVGYSFDYSLVRLPVLDQDGFPVQDHGITRYPGLYFVGMPWMPSERSGALIGMHECARRVAFSIRAQMEDP